MESIKNRLRPISFMEYKQVILVRKDIDMDKGKMSAQVAHASVDAVTGSLKLY